jgi:hypothetical protein
MQQECLDGLVLQLAFLREMIEHKLGEHTGIASTRRCLLDIKCQAKTSAKTVAVVVKATPYEAEADLGGLVVGPAWHIHL